MADHAKKDQSQAQQKNAQRAADGRKAMADYEAEASALRAKTERLKALRLAKEAAEGIAAPKPPAAPKKKSATAAKGTKGAKGKKGAKGDSSTLSDWLQTQEKGGRRT